jgi:hypothetical protein
LPAADRGRKTPPVPPSPPAGPNNALENASHSAEPDALGLGRPIGACASACEKSYSGVSASSRGVELGGVADRVMELAGGFKAFPKRLSTGEEAWAERRVLRATESQDRREVERRRALGFAEEVSADE